tara:strand:+ start:407 stop:517 length:111 start_codon:yes stop_codon:yes gene_type:complete
MAAWRRYMQRDPTHMIGKGIIDNQGSFGVYKNHDER